MAQGETIERILHSATFLFAERGFSETSLRTITGMAEVNLAAVNYHFGSKKELIQAVFARFLKPYCREVDHCVDALLQQRAEGKALTINDLLDCLFKPLLTSTESINEDPQRFMRLLSLAYTQSQEHLRVYLCENFGSTFERFADLMKETTPETNTVVSFWQMYFMLGSAVFTLSSYDSIRAILNSDHQQDTTLVEVIELLTPSLSNMLVAGHA